MEQNYGIYINVSAARGAAKLYSLGKSTSAPPGVDKVEEETRLFIHTAIESNNDGVYLIDSRKLYPSNASGYTTLETAAKSKFGVSVVKKPRTSKYYFDKETSEAFKLKTPPENTTAPIERDVNAAKVVRAGNSKPGLKSMISTYGLIARRRRSNDEADETSTNHKKEKKDDKNDTQENGGIWGRIGGIFRQ